MSFDYAIRLIRLSNVRLVCVAAGAEMPFGKVRLVKATCFPYTIQSLHALLSRGRSVV